MSSTVVIPLESAVVRRVTRLLDARGAWWIKTTGVSKVGCPDIIACYRGRFVAIECKRPKVGRLSRKQEVELDKIRLARGSALVASGIYGLVALLDEIDAWI